MEVTKLTKSLQEMTADRDLQVTKLAEFEKTNTDYIESAQTSQSMKDGHKLEIDNLTKEHEAKLAATENKVAEKAIQLLASQGTNVVIEQNCQVMTIESARQILASLKGQEAQTFYAKNKELFAGYIK